jgi:hypothetical protein
MSTDSEDLVFFALPTELVFTIIDGLKVARDDDETCADCYSDYSMIIDMLLTILDKDSPDWVDRLDDMLRDK